MICEQKLSYCDGVQTGILSSLAPSPHSYIININTAASFNASTKLLYRRSWVDKEPYHYSTIISSSWQKLGCIGPKNLMHIGQKGSLEFIDFERPQCNCVSMVYMQAFWEAVGRTKTVFILPFVHFTNYPYRSRQFLNGSIFFITTVLSHTTIFQVSVGFRLLITAWALLRIRLQLVPDCTAASLSSELVGLFVPSENRVYSTWFPNYNKFKQFFSAGSESRVATVSVSCTKLNH